ELSAPDGVWFVTGNHEYYSGALQWLDWVRDAGWRPLVNEHAAIERSGDRLILGGVTDFRAERRLPEHRSDPAAAFAGAGQGARLLLAHQPKSVPQARGLDVALALCGHTHGGQYVPWNLLVEFFHPYVRGLNRDPDGAWVYVSRGTGYWGPPIRTGVPAELTLLTLRAV
ncbi:MAG: metallophosphoesterase, partial [Candidatus Dadabacteria bacterium]